jgi:Tol biopolymer transport system component
MRSLPDQPPGGPQQSPESARLESWKEIAAYLKRDLRTVQRWEKAEALPVHRHVHNKLSTVYAFTAELEAWRASRRAELGYEGTETGKGAVGRRRVWAVALAAVLAAAALAVWRFLPRNPTRLAWKVVPVTAYPGLEQYPSFSPDGKQVAFTWNGEKQDRFDVYVKLLGPGPPLRLTHDPAEELFPTWSPDGRWIAFLRTIHGATRAVYIIPSLGGPERKLGEVDGGIFPGYPSPFLDWTPDSKGLIVVDREQAEDSWSLFLLSVETGEKRRLTRAPVTSFDSSPAISPDGRALAFVRLEQGTLHGVYLQPLAEDFTAQEEPRRLTSEAWGVSNLSWTADGTGILASDYKEDNRGLWIIARTGGPAKPLSSIGESVRHLRVSRQGDRLAYVQENLDSDIWRLELGGRRKAVTRLISSTRRDMTPHLSPNGKRVAYASYRSGHSEIWVLNIDDSESVQVTSFNGPFLLGPRWSPDGTGIAFSAGVEKNSEIYIVSAGGGKPRRVTVSPGRDILPDWSPDGRWIYFTSSRGESQQVWRAPAGGGEALQVSRHEGVVRSAYLSPDGRFVYYKIGNPIGALWRVPVEGGAQTKVVDSVFQRNFQVMEDGIYFMSETKPAKSYTFQFFRFSDRRMERLAEIEQNVGAGISISRDGRYLLYWAWEQRGGDIMVVENFRW